MSTTRTRVLIILVILTQILTPTTSTPTTPTNRGAFLDQLTNQLSAYGPLTVHQKLAFAELIFELAALQNFEESPDLTCSKPIVPFNCKVSVNETRAEVTNVNELTIADVDVVMAMGDSITAGFGALASCILTVFREAVGVSWSIGGDYSTEQLITLPNIVKQYNPKVKGFSTGSRLYGFSSQGTNLNAAVSGSRSVDLLDQAKWLVERLNAKGSGVNMNKDWKMLTVFIGGNDLCDFCKNPGDNSAVNYGEKLTEALRYLQANVPRLFVNIAAAVDVTELYQLNGEGLLCSLLHSYECPCGTSSDAAVRKSVSDEHKKYLEVGRRVSHLFDNDPNFAVVMQPFFTNTHVPRKPDGSVDMSFFAPDCFHFSVKAHQAAAVGLWNNMFEPVGSKDESYDWPVEPIVCPGPGQILRTNDNSK